MTFTRPVSVLTLAASVALALTSCFSERVTDLGTTSRECLLQVPSPAFGTNQTLIAMRDYNFQPDTVRVRAGQVVTWVNCDAEGHTSTSNSGVWSSPTVPLSATYSRTFAQPGRYPYHCIPHPTMTGVVVVE